MDHEADARPLRPPLKHLAPGPKKLDILLKCRLWCDAQLQMLQEAALGGEPDAALDPVTANAARFVARLVLALVEVGAEEAQSRADSLLLMMVEEKAVLGQKVAVESLGNVRHGRICTSGPPPSPGQQAPLLEQYWTRRTTQRGDRFDPRGLLPSTELGVSGQLLEQLPAGS